MSKTGKAAKPQDPIIDADVLKKAQGMGLESSLKNLMTRPDIIAKDLSHAELFSALEKSGGLV